MSKLHRDNAGYVGCSYEETQDPYYSYNKLSLPLAESDKTVLYDEVTFTVTVAGGKFVIDGTSQATVSLIEGNVYTFDQSDSSNSGHPLRFSYTEDGTHGDGVEMTLGVTTNGTPGSAGAYTKIVVPFGLHDLYYYCSVHSGYGGFANVNKDPLKFTTGLPILKTTDAFGKTLGTGNNEDPYAANLVLAIPMNGANNGTTFTDVSNVIRGSGSAHTVSVAGDTKTVTSEFKYYGSSAAFDNSGDYLSLPDTSALHLNGEECTIEGWFYTNDAPGAGGGNAIPFFAQADVNTNSTSGTANFWSFADSGFWYFGSSTGYMTISPSNIPVGSWFHFACVVTNTTQAKMYVNGELKGEGTIGAIGNGTSKTTNLGVITSGASIKSYLNGYIQDFRMYNVAKYTTPFPTGGYGMDVVTYTGTGNQMSISSLQFQPDLVWIKRRDGLANHSLHDVVRGVGYELSSSTTGAEDTQGKFVSFDSNGWTMNGGYGTVNLSGQTFVAWCWKAGGAPTTDNVAGAGNVPTAGSVKIDGANMTTALAGSIAATRLSVNTTYGFSIVSYSGANSVSTVAHGLGAAPGMIIVKRRSPSGYGWIVYHSAMGASNMMALQNTSAAALDFDPWNQTAPTSSVFTVNTTGSGTVNASGADYIAYCWSEVPGFSKFGEFTGLCSSAKTVTLGFRPKFLIIKRKENGADGDTTYGGWGMYQNATDQQLMANCSGEEGVRGNCATGSSKRDIQANVTFNDDGFTVDSCWYEQNDTVDYIYAAFAESAPGDPAFESLVVDQLDLKDRSGNGNNASNGGATWQTSVKKFYDGSVKLINSTNNYLTIPNSDDFNFAGGDWTCELWAYPTSTTSRALLTRWGETGQTTGSWSIMSNIVYLSSNGSGITTTINYGQISVNQWSHLAVVRRGNTVTVYVNGSPAASGSFSGSLYQNNFGVNLGNYGTPNNTTQYCFDGYIQDVRIYKGIAKYTSSFTPPERSVQGTARRYPSGVYVVS